MGNLQPRLTVICTATSVSVPQRVVWWIGTNGDPPDAAVFNTRPGVLNMRHPDGTTRQGDLRTACRSQLRGRDGVPHDGRSAYLDKRMPASRHLSVADILDDIVNHTTCAHLTDQWGRNVFEPDAQFSCYTKTPWLNDDPMRAISWRNKMPVPSANGITDARSASAEGAFLYTGYNTPYGSPYPDYYYYGQYGQYGGFSNGQTLSHPGEDLYGYFFDGYKRPWLQSSAQDNGLACHPAQPRTWHPVVMDNVQDPAVYEVWLSEVSFALSPSAGPHYGDEETPCAISNFNHGFFPVSSADGGAQCTTGPDPSLLDNNTRLDSIILCDPSDEFRRIAGDSFDTIMNYALSTRGYWFVDGDTRRSKALHTVAEPIDFRMDSGAICDAQCVHGWVAVGTLKCLNGNWTYSDFKCVRQYTGACELPGDVDQYEFNDETSSFGLRNSLNIDEHIVGVSGAGCGHVSEDGASCSFHCDFGLDHQAVLAFRTRTRSPAYAIERRRRAQQLSDGVGQITCDAGQWVPGSGYGGCTPPTCEEHPDGGTLNWTRNGVDLTDNITRQFPLWRDQTWYNHPSGTPTYLTVPQGSIQGNGHFKGGAMWTFGQCPSLGTGNKFCVTCHSKHCSVYAVVWHQPGMSEGLNGAIPALEQQGWTPGGRCAPKFWANITDTPLCFWPTVALRYDMACGESVCIDQALLGSSTDLRHFAIIGTRRKNCADNTLNDEVSCEQQEPYYANTCEWVDNQCVERAAWCPTPQASEGTSTSGGGTSGGGTSGGGEDRFMCTTPPWSGSECSPISAPL
eukprot:TRINITY_DN295_c0_g1_i3.p1 TRINITY_DN295_c0_g1~~TRINITY_DN295_c0_g1_i3.p1  ORF type:complete len:792 (+),score=115.17 TRINITY_DN295_c0_g1_i3:114-2489(+)